MNKSYLIISLFLFVLTSCRKSTVNNPVPPVAEIPSMKYKNLGDVQIAFRKSYTCDIDNDGINDFSIHTEYLGKPAENVDCEQFYFSGAYLTFSPVDLNEQTPLLHTGDVIGKMSYANHFWYNASHLLLSEKVITESGNDYWRGKWKDASHQYLALAVEKNGKRYYGWLELSFSQRTETVVLHRAAIAEQPEKDVFAGK